MKRIRLYIAALLLCLAGGAMADVRSTVENNTVQTEQQATIKATNGAVEVDNVSDQQVDVAVFAITGSLVCHRSLAPGESLRIDLSAGYYIVKAGESSKRVAVK